MINDSEQKAIEELKKDLDIEIKECSSSNDYRHLSGLYLNGNVETVLNLISKLQKVIEKTCRYINEAKIMNKAIPVYPNKVDTPYTVGVASIEEIKQYFYKQVEKVGGEDE